jgi:hypothetical protein
LHALKDWVEPFFSQSVVHKIDRKKRKRKTPTTL